MTKNVDWYSYNKGKMIYRPNVGEEIQVRLGSAWFNAEVVAHSQSDFYFFFDSKDYRGVLSYKSDSDDVRPLDWNKNQKKPVDLSWLVDSGVDCEFSHDRGNWFISKLRNIGSELYFSENLGGFDYCRPRMNHPMVLTQKQVDLIPDGFEFCLSKRVESYQGLDPNDKGAMVYFIFTFTGLSDGCFWPWEVSCE